MLQFCDISIDKKNGLINLSLSSSISDQLAIGTNLVIPRFENVTICPVHTLLNYYKWDTANSPTRKNAKKASEKQDENRAVS
jgi:hypothetical protein